MLRAMKALLVVVVLASAAHADSSIAYESDGKLVVAKVEADKLTTLVEEPATGVLEYRFADSTTLWVVRAQQGVYSVEKISDGKASPPRALTLADWLRPGEKPPEKPAGSVVELAVMR